MALDFSIHVLRSFDFLQSDYLFHCVDVNDYCVRYESDTVFVTVRFDKGHSFELGVEIGQRGVVFNGKERPFNLGEILRLKGVEKKEDYSFLQTRDQTHLKSAINRLSNLLKTYGTDLLNGDRFAFKSLIDLRIRECAEYAATRDLKFIRNEAEKAWKEKDFTKVVDLFSSVKAYITDSEKKKLEYAKKKIP